MTEAEKLLVTIKFVVDMYSSGATSADLALEQIFNLIDKCDLVEQELSCPYCDEELTKVSTSRYTCKTEWCLGYLCDFMVLK